MRALTHRSYAYEHGGLPNNERLEFLGDSVLGLVVTDTLYRTHPDLPEGQLAKLRAAVVNMRALADVARTIGLGEYVFLGRGEEATGGRDKASILADTMEALIGTIHLSGGMATRQRLRPPSLRPADDPVGVPRGGAGLEDQPPGAGRLGRARHPRVPRRRVRPGPREAVRGQRRRRARRSSATARAAARRRPSSGPPSRPGPRSTDAGGPARRSSPRSRDDPTSAYAWSHRGSVCLSSPRSRPSAAVWRPTSSAAGSWRPSSAVPVWCAATCPARPTSAPGSSSPW